ncbi:MAG: 16S rRNA (cytidine(1402)-2'-O)-methyltransferase [Anaerolineae bacterium]|nr:16S rRNA (cytidine(1402)-2'-O)-methyltransferase [Anaerolineae bacterium]NIN96762.1 16S rRNA (cytidine(1402)-2'-O)-methyltransferase [Anaerolineae bacterium]NIQ79758.1 16S rRNA (cytidine(1402)-2'-O)-methyltransferase [Anaerolineae bacterium]
MGTLYIVGTPIGNLEDITIRALRILEQVGLIAAEDTRATGKLLTRYEIETPLTSYWEQNKLTKLEYILGALEQKDVALVSKAGMPGISDPGYELIRAALERGIEVLPVPGPSAITAALVVSGLPTDSFTYLGFLPRKKGQRARLLASLTAEQRTIVAFEAPHRLLAALADIRDTLGDRRMAVTRELTKLHEEVVRGAVSEVIQHFEKAPPRGEMTLIIEGAAEASWDQGMIEEALVRLKHEGIPGKEAVKEVAKVARRPRNEVYRIWLSMEDA